MAEAAKRGFETAYEPCIAGRAHACRRWTGADRTGLICLFCDRTWAIGPDGLVETARGRNA